MRRRFMALIFGMVLGLFSCAAPPPPVGPTLEEVQQTLETAWLYHDYIQEELIAGEEYEQTVFDDAHESLISADDFFVEGQLPESQALATESLETFQQILSHFDTVRYVPGLEGTLKELEQIVESDPDNPLVEFLPDLQQMLDNAETQQEKIEQGELRDLTQMRTDIEQFRQLQKIIREGDRVEQEIGDVSFETGEYDLSDTGKELLSHFADDIVTMIATRSKDFPGKKINVKIKVVGYTDDQGFRHDSSIARRLLNESGETEPADRHERDTLLNLLLSEKRADTISTHLAEYVNTSFQGDEKLHIEQQSSGKGNAIPPSVVAPYPKEDARRRISRIYSYVIAY